MATHKYIERYWKNGKYYYVYPEEKENNAGKHSVDTRNAEAKKIKNVLDNKDYYLKQQLKLSEEKEKKEIASLNKKIKELKKTRDSLRFQVSRFPTRREKGLKGVEKDYDNKVAEVEKRRKQYESEVRAGKYSQTTLKNTYDKIQKKFDQELVEIEQGRKDAIIDAKKYFDKEELRLKNMLGNTVRNIVKLENRIDDAQKAATKERKQMSEDYKTNRNKLKKVYRAIKPNVFENTANKISKTASEAASSISKRVNNILDKLKIKIKKK